MGAMGVGALASALSLAARRSVRGSIRMIPVAAGIFGLGLIGFGLSHVFWLSMLMVLVAGMGMMQGMAASNTIIQTLTDEDKRGRVMSYYTMAFMGMATFGSLLAGTLAHAIPPTPMWLVGKMPLAGAQWTVILNGVAVVIGALWFATRLPARGKWCGQSIRRWELFRRRGRWRPSRCRITTSGDFIMLSCTLSPTFGTTASIASVKS